MIFQGGGEKTPTSCDVFKEISGAFQLWKEHEENRFRFDPKMAKQKTTDGFLSRNLDPKNAGWTFNKV